MSARDDYPWLAREQTMGQGCYYPHPQGLAAIDEIDRLRAEVAAERTVRKQLAGLLAPWPANHWTCNEEFVAWQVEVARTLAASDALDQEATR